MTPLSDPRSSYSRLAWELAHHGKTYALRREPGVRMELPTFTLLEPAAGEGHTRTEAMVALACELDRIGSGDC